MVKTQASKESEKNQNIQYQIFEYMKVIIRKDLIKKRKQLSIKEVLEKSNQIKKRLFKIYEFKQASKILFYISYNNEVYTHDMIKECISNKKNVIIPISNKKNKCLILSQLDNWNNLESGSYGILELGKNKIKKTSINKVDLIIVPGIGFDESGYRIGHGKGYYDALLRNSTKAFHIGLAFESQIVKKIPIEAHDIPVHIIITERRVINCKRTM